MRVSAGVGAIEYAVELEVKRAGHSHLEMTLLGRQPVHRMRGVPNPLRPPRYSFGPFSDLPALVGLAASDIANAGGLDCAPDAWCVTGPAQTLSSVEQGVPVRE